MRRSMVAAAAFIAAGIVGLDAQAQVPRGSYLQTCKNVQFDGYTLRAICADVYGGARPSRIAVDQCPGGIANANGQLVCAGPERRRYGRDDNYDRSPPRDGGGFAGRGGRLPPGSWQASCSNPSMQGSVLVAVCATVSGRARQSEIDAGSCRGIANRNGQLVCE